MPKKSLMTDHELLIRLDEKITNLVRRLEDGLMSIAKDVEVNYVKREAFLVLKAKVENNIKFRNGIIIFIVSSF